MNKTKAAKQRLTAVHNYIIFYNIITAGRFYECSEWKAELLSNYTQYVQLSRIISLQGSSTLTASVW